jgi:hypothetical protein
MALDVGVYRPNEVLVEAVQVTELNALKVAEWCNGVLQRTHMGAGHPYVMFRDIQGEYQTAVVGAMIVHDPTVNSYIVMDKEEFKRLYWRINEVQ